jgi:hypothetical protein
MYCLVFRENIQIERPAEIAGVLVARSDENVPVTMLGKILVDVNLLGRIVVVKNHKPFVWPGGEPILDGLHCVLLAPALGTRRDNFL